MYTARVQDPRKGTLRLLLLCGFVLAVLVALAPRPAGASRPPVKDKKQRPMTRLRVEVTGGADNRPVGDASVYVKFPANPKSSKSKDLELNLKTNQEGVAESPSVPQGKILVQVIAPGWKTYGQWLDIEEPDKTVPVHLDRPTNWY